MGDDVVDLAVVGVDVDGDLGVVEELGEVGLDGGLGLGDGHAHYGHAAVAAQRDSAVGADQVQAGDLLSAAGLGERDRGDQRRSTVSNCFWMAASASSSVMPETWTAP